MTIVFIALCILVLVLLITWVKINSFIAFILVSVLAGVLFKMPLEKIAASINKGIGDTFGSVVIVIVFGAMLGNLVAKSGAAQRIALSMRNLAGPGYITYAMAATGLIIGIPLYYNTGFVLLIPIVFSVAAGYRLRPLYVGLPILAALSVMHGFLPPHPSPMTLVSVFHANVLTTFMYGLMVAVPAILLAGPVFASTLKNAGPDHSFTILKVTDVPDADLPGIVNSLLSALLPVVIIGIAYTLSVFHVSAALTAAAQFFSDPVIAMLLAVLVSTYTLGVSMGKPVKDVMRCFADAVKDIAMILLIIGSAGALKQVFIDSGVTADLAGVLSHNTFPPLVLAWGVTAGLRLCLGSATIAGLTAAGVLLPLVAHAAVNPNLLVLVIGAGSLFGSHVNDTAFWLYKEYFGLSMKDTFRSWTIMESMVSVIGLIGVLTLNSIIKK